MTHANNLHLEKKEPNLIRKTIAATLRGRTWCGVTANNKVSSKKKKKLKCSNSKAITLQDSSQDNWEGTNFSTLLDFQMAENQNSLREPNLAYQLERW